MDRVEPIAWTWDGRRRKNKIFLSCVLVIWSSAPSTLSWSLPSHPHPHVLTALSSLSDIDPSAQLRVSPMNVLCGFCDLECWFSNYNMRFMMLTRDLFCDCNWVIHRADFFCFIVASHIGAGCQSSTYQCCLCGAGWKIRYLLDSL